MPIYAYRCGACGHAQDVLQKMSDPLLTICPACGAEAYTKQLTAAGFQLKGSGWYVTDFREGAKGAKPGAAGKDEAGGSGQGEKSAEKSADQAADKSTNPSAEPSADKSAAKSASSSPASASEKPAGSSGPSATAAAPAAASKPATPAAGG